MFVCICKFLRISLSDSDFCRLTTGFEELEELDELEELEELEELDELDELDELEILNISYV